MSGFYVLLLCLVSFAIPAYAYHRRGINIRKNEIEAEDTIHWLCKKLGAANGEVFNLREEMESVEKHISEQHTMQIEQDAPAS